MGMSRTEYIVTGEAMIVGGQIKGELIRCKECRFYPNCEGATKCLPCREIITPPAWYCADGEAKDDT